MLNWKLLFKAIPNSPVKDRNYPADSPYHVCLGVICYSKMKLSNSNKLKKKSSSSVQWECSLYNLLWQRQRNLLRPPNSWSQERFPTASVLPSCRKLAWSRDIGSAPPDLTPTVINRSYVFGSEGKNPAYFCSCLWQLALVVSISTHQ